MKQQHHSGIRFWVGFVGLLWALAWAANVQAADEAASAAAREEYAYTVGVQAYVYGFPLVEMARVRWQATWNPDNKGRTPPNQFRHRRELLDAKSRLVVAPNNDTLYSSAFLDLSQGPVVLDVPDTGGRYFVMQFMDFYTNNFAYVGKRTTGSGAGSFAVAGPNWQGRVPSGVKLLRSPTHSVWLLGRTLVDGADDLPAVHALQDRYLLTPLSQWHASATADTAALSPTYSPPLRPNPAEPLDFFDQMNAMLRENPPPATESAVLALFAKVGIGPAFTAKVADGDAATARGLLRAITTAKRLIDDLPTGRPVSNGWLGFSANTGHFGDDYRYRAFVARFALAANDPAEAHNFTTKEDADGRPLNGSHRYLLRFEPGQSPPVAAFWSLTMYGLPGDWFIDNAIDRYALGDRSKDMKRTPDGALEIIVQRDPPPADQAANWLPAPSGDFELALRCYLPDPAIVEGRWKPPTVKLLP